MSKRVYIELRSKSPDDPERLLLLVEYGINQGTPTAADGPGTEAAVAQPAMDQPQRADDEVQMTVKDRIGEVEAEQEKAAAEANAAEDKPPGARRLASAKEQVDKMADLGESVARLIQSGDKVIVASVKLGGAIAAATKLMGLW